MKTGALLKQLKRYLMRFLDRYAATIVVISLVLLAMLLSGCAKDYVVREGVRLELSRDQSIYVWKIDADGVATEITVKFFAQDTIVRGHVP